MRGGHLLLLKVMAECEANKRGVCFDVGSLEAVGDGHGEAHDSESSVWPFTQLK